jgi:ABC-type lipoprotein release transport system permease subunit
MVVFYLAVFIYFIQRRKEYAIARALGSGKARSLWSNTIPMIIIAIIGIGIGIISSWHFAISRGEAVLADIEGAVFLSPPTLWIMYVYAILFGLFLLFLGVEVCKLATRSELELLQGSRASKTKKKVYKITFLEDEEQFERIRLNLSYITEYPKKLQGLGTAFMVRLSRKYLIRKPLKSTLAIAIAFAFMVVLGWMPTSIEENIQQIDLLYDNTVVTATTVVDPISGATRRGSVPDTLLQEIISLTPSMDDAESEIGNEEDYVSEMFIANYYAEAQHHMALTNIEGWEDTIDPEGEWWEYFEWEEIAGFNNQDVFEDFHDLDLNIIFADGFDMEVFEQSDIDEPVILISQRFKTGTGVNFGDYLELVAAEQASRLRPSDFMPYKIIGSFDVQGYGINLITPLVNLQNHIGRDLRHNQVELELNPALNRELELFRIQVDELMVGTNPQLVFILRDHILREVINPLEQSIIMMSTLYPIILALSGIIALGIVILLLLGTTKDVAIMRATGVPKLRVMIILGMEQIILCITGLLIGVIVSAIAFGAVNLLGVILYFSGYTLGAIIVLVILANRKPLDLLQVKE